MQVYSQHPCAKPLVKWFLC